jgi:hypothetical protein
MASLMVGIVDGAWALQIENVPDLRWAFKGDDLATQAEWVREFALQMSEDTPEFALSALAGVEADDIVYPMELFFADTSGIVLEGQVVFLAADDTTLIDVLVEAGEALLEALV